jgi:hypothetical protein
MPSARGRAGVSVCRVGTAARTGLAAAAAVLLLCPPASDATASHCTAKRVRGALVQFVGAFNRGDYEALDGLFAQEPQFQWLFSDRPGRRVGPAARNRATLIRYFKARHARSDRLSLLSFHFTGNSPRWGNFELRARRSAGDYRGGRWFGALAKGAAVCSGRETSFIVLTFAGPSPG